MPISASIKYFTADDGLKLYYQHWIPENPKALLVYIHDIGDHIGNQGPFTKYFVDRNYAVALYDQRGQGKSEGRRGDAKEFGEFIRDLSSFINFSRGAVPPQIPLVLVGNGVGAQLVINLLVPAWHAVSWGGLHPGKIDGFITIRAAIEPIITMPRWRLKLNNHLVRFFPSLRVNNISLRLQKELLDNTQLIMAMASRIQLPSLMLHGKEDKTASPEGTKQFFLRLPSPLKRMHLYDEPQEHEIFNNIEKWLEDVLSFAIRNTQTLSQEKLCELLPMPL